MTKTFDRHAGTGTTGRVLHEPARYDLMVWLATFGRERVFRQKVLDLARLAPGEVVLDVGCGTGTLAIAAKKRVGPSGSVSGIDASPEMIERAAAKSRKARVEVGFQNAIGEALPFPDAKFDIVLSTIMLHHLPRKARLQCVREMLRVAKPGGRVLAVDFEGSEGHTGRLLQHFHRRHGHVKASDLMAVLSESGLVISENGTVGIGDMHFVLATAP